MCVCADKKISWNFIFHKLIVNYSVHCVCMHTYRRTPPATVPVTCVALQPLTLATETQVSCTRPSWAASSLASPTTTPVETSSLAGAKSSASELPLRQTPVPLPELSFMEVGASWQARESTYVVVWTMQFVVVCVCTLRVTKIWTAEIFDFACYYTCAVQVILM